MLLAGRRPAGEGKTMITPEDLDVGWFEGVLQRRYPGVRVAAVERTSGDEWTNVHVRVSLSYAEDAGAPGKVFVKLPPADEMKAKAYGSAAMGAREARFYDRLAPVLDLRAPVPHGVVTADDGDFAIVIEDLVDTGCSPFNSVGVSPDAAAVALDDLAAMHVRYEDERAREGDEVSWVQAPPVPPPPKPGDEPNIGQVFLRQGIEVHRDRLNDAYVAVAEQWIGDLRGLQLLWWDAPLTVIHGDPHPGNLFDDGGRVGFLDWGLISLGDPMRDASYFVNLALETEVRRANERDLLRHYLETRRRLGGREIGWEDAWDRHRIHAAYLVPASCPALAVPEDSNEADRELAATFLARAVAAVEDLDTPQAIKGAGGRG
jgi:hypothetical protein